MVFYTFEGKKFAIYIMSATKVLTAQNVIISLKSNIVLWRVLAYILDILVIIAYIYAIIQALDSIDMREESPGFNVFLTLIALPVVFYSLISEFLLNGKSIGKLICGIRVVKINGLRCGYNEYLLRWLFRMIDVYPIIFLSFFIQEYGLIGNALIGVPAFIMATTTKNHQRLGDIVAGTTVIKVKNKVDFASTIFKEVSDDYEPTFTQVVKLSDNDMRIIKDTFLQAQKDKNYETIHKLRLKVQEVMQVNSNLNDEDFLQTVINDFNHYTKDM